MKQKSLGRHFFSGRKDRRDFTKTVKFPRTSSSKLFRSPGKNAATGSEKNYISLWESRAKNLKQENFEFRHHFGDSVKKLFLKSSTFYVSVQRWVSPFDFPIFSLIFFVLFIYIVLNEMFCVLLNYAQRNLCNVYRNLFVKFISLEINSLLGDKCLFVSEIQWWFFVC